MTPPSAAFGTKPRATIARRILASFGVTLAAFAVTVGYSLVAQRRAVDDYDELVRAYLPTTVRLGQLRATQATLSTLVDGIPDERNPLSTRLLLEMLASQRRAKFEETRASLEEWGREGGAHAAPARALARELTMELERTAATLEDDRRLFERLFASIDAQDKDAVNRVLLPLGALEHDADARLRGAADRLSQAMDSVSLSAKERHLRSIYALLTLAVVTLAVGVAVAWTTRRLLAPLARVTERAQAVARGDLAPREVTQTEDEMGQLAAAFERMVAAVARAQSLALSNERLAAIGKMAAHVTHEIRNPLSSIGLNLELLQEELEGSQVSGDARGLLKAIAREVERLEHLSEEYLRVARLPSPRMEADDLGQAVRDIVTFARPEAEHAGCTIRLLIQEPVPPALFDESQLRQALLNLLRNAREAMPAGGAIDVRVAAEGMSVVIDVADRGSGIPEPIRARVFDPFFSTKGEGTGLGLAITRHIVEAHGGTVTCDAREGGGTRFRLALPIAPARATSFPPPAALPAPGPTSSATPATPSTASAEHGPTSAPGPASAAGGGGAT